MARNRDVTPKNKLMAIKEYLAKQGSLNTISKKYGVNESTLR